jgi:hypothetical protein
MERIVDGDWAAAEEMLAAAAGKKEGWGWGVNNGDIWIALGAVQAIRWGEAALPDVTAARPDGLLERAAATLQLAAERRPDHPWTRQNVVAVRELKELVGRCPALCARCLSAPVPRSSWAVSVPSAA